MKKFPMGDIHRISRQTCDKTIYIISLKCSLHEIFYIHIFQHKCIEQKGQKNSIMNHMVATLIPPFSIR